MEPQTVAVLQEAATELRAAARAHKRSEQAHKRQARELMARLARLQALCEQHGIRLITEAEVEGGQGLHERRPA